MPDAGFREKKEKEKNTNNKFPHLDILPKSHEVWDLCHHLKSLIPLCKLYIVVVPSRLGIDLHHTRYRRLWNYDRFHCHNANLKTCRSDKNHIFHDVLRKDYIDQHRTPDTSLYVLNLPRSTIFLLDKVCTKKKI